MHLLHRLAALVVVTLGGAWAVLFCLANTQELTLDLLLVRLPAAPVSIWVLGAFVAGGLCGLLAASVALWRARLALRAARRAGGRGAAATPAAQ